AFARLGDRVDGDGEDQGIGGSIGGTGVGHAYGHQLTGYHIALWSDQDRPAAFVSRVEGVERLRQGREAIPGRDPRILAVVQRRHIDTNPQLVLVDELHDENVLRRV